MSSLSTSSTIVPATISRFWRDRALWTSIADVFAVLTALSFPWSTSLVAIFVLCWLGAVAWVMDYPAFLGSLKRPACYLPLAFFALAAIGMAWSEASWAERLRGLLPLAKFVVLPFLFYHFERSRRGTLVLAAFVASCALLSAFSWITALEPAFTLKPRGGEVCGIFVKNYIDQSQEFALCAVALAFPVVTLFRRGARWLAAGVAVIAVGFLLSLCFVVAARTALFTLPALFTALAWLCLGWRKAVLITLAAAALSFAMVQSPRLCPTFDTFGDYERYKDTNAPTSTGLRLEFWRKSIGFFAEAPMIGHGTGSIRHLFEQASLGKTGAAGEVIGNPHNQTLNVAVQWGALGIALLYAMWLVHLWMFRTPNLMAAVGLLVVVQNMATSLFNSHLFDVHEGWMYVLGVGIAGGALLRGRAADNAAS